MSWATVSAPYRDTKSGMRTYENLLLPLDEWFISSTMNLDDNGRFRYDELWSCYAGSTNSKAEGKWRQTESCVVLETERIEGSPRLGLVEGQCAGQEKVETKLSFLPPFLVFNSISNSSGLL